MRAQDGSRGHWSDFAFEAEFDGLGFARFGDYSDDLIGFQDLANGHGDGLAGNFGKIAEPGFADLLAATGFVEIDEEIGLFGLEIGGRVVEGEMAVFTDAGEGEVDGRGAEELAYAVDYFVGIGVAVEQVILRDAGFVNQALEKVFAKAGGMRDWQADVFVEMKEFDAVPVDFFRTG